MATREYFGEGVLILDDESGREYFGEGVMVLVSGAAPGATVPPLLEGHMLTGGFQTQGM